MKQIKIYALFVFVFFLVLITNAQNVGIGILNPQAKLTVFDNVLSGALFQNTVSGSTASDGIYMGLLPNSINSTIMNFEIGSLSLGTNNVGHLIIDPNGNVGIGGPPLHKFDIKGNTSNIMDISGGDQMFVTLSENGIKKGYFGSYNQSISQDDVDFGTYSNTNGAVHLVTKGIPRLTIANNGDVGIGGSPSHKFDVIGTSSNIMEISGGDQMYVTLAENGVRKGYFGSYNQSISSDDVDFGTYGDTNGALHLITRGVPRLTVENSGNTRFSGKITVNSTNGIVRSSNSTQLRTLLYQSPSNLSLNFDSGDSGVIGITFTAFSSPPTVSVGDFYAPAGSSFSGIDNLLLIVTDVTTTSANIRVKNVGNSNATLDKMALKCIIIGPE